MGTFEGAQSISEQPNNTFPYGTPDEMQTTSISNEAAQD